MTFLHGLYRQTALYHYTTMTPNGTGCSCDSANCCHCRLRVVQVLTMRNADGPCVPLLCAYNLCSHCSAGLALMAYRYPPLPDPLWTHHSRAAAASNSSSSSSTSSAVHSGSPELSISGVMFAVCCAVSPLLHATSQPHVMVSVCTITLVCIFFLQYRALLTWQRGVNGHCSLIMNFATLLQRGSAYSLILLL
jgi:hypothetical protein